MNPLLFQAQMQRLITRFGQKAFDPEFSKLVWSEVRDMSEPGFVRFCDVLIGSRTAHKPPLLSEFREARMNEQKLKFENEVRDAAQSLRRAPAEMREHLRKLLEKEMGAGIETLSDAVELVQLRNRTAGGPEGEGA